MVGHPLFDLQSSELAYSHVSCPEILCFWTRKSTITHCVHDQEYVVFLPFKQLAHSVCILKRMKFICSFDLDKPPKKHIITHCVMVGDIYIFVVAAHT